jgi:hypothetical protein
MFRLPQQQQQQVARVLMQLLVQQGRQSVPSLLSL